MLSVVRTVIKTGWSIYKNRVAIEDAASAAAAVAKGGTVTGGRPHGGKRHFWSHLLSRIAVLGTAFAGGIAAAPLLQDAPTQAFEALRKESEPTVARLKKETEEMFERFYLSDQGAQRAALEEAITNYATPALHTELLGHQVVVQHSKGLPWMPITVIGAEDWLDMHAKWERMLSEAGVKKCVDGAGVRDGYVAGGSTTAMTKALRCAENYRPPRGTREP